MADTAFDVFGTDFGMCTLDAAFVAEAAKRWPGKRVVKHVDLGGDLPDWEESEPAWVRNVQNGINAVARHAYESDLPMPHLRTLQDVGF